jgi:tRNA (guanine-N7-)-methyltransferase
VTVPETPVPWQHVFGNDRPVEVEIGPGRGVVLLAFAEARPAVNFFAVERGRRDVDAILAKASRRGLENVRIIAGDARCVVARLVPSDSVTAYHIYFPDPWPKNRHRRRRVVDPQLAAHLARTLVRGGALHLATDLPGLLADFALPLLDAGLVRVESATPPARPRTSFEQRYAQAGTHYARFERSGGETGAPAPEVDCWRYNLDDLLNPTVGRKA